MSGEIVGYVRDRHPVVDGWVGQRVAPEGFRVVIVDELQRPNSGWVRLPEMKPCRLMMRTEGRRHQCGQPSYFGFYRGSGKRRYPWAYCDMHLFGRHHEAKMLLAAILCTVDHEHYKGAGPAAASRSGGTG